MTFKIEHHGTSGRWYPTREDKVPTMFEALIVCEAIKRDGYGARIVREDGSVAMDASWQTPVDWSVEK